MQTGEFYQLEINQQNFQGPKGNYGGLFSGGRYKFENKPSNWVTEYTPARPVEWITEVGPTPPRFGNAHENVPCWAPAHGLGDRPECNSVSDSGATALMLLGTSMLVLLARRVFA